MLPSNPAQMAKLMRQMGISTKDLPCKRVIFELEDTRIIVEPAQVMEISAKGIRTFQVSGEVKEEPLLSAEDVRMVMEQTGCSEEEAKKALERAGGDLAQAIMLIQEEGD